VRRQVDDPSGGDGALTPFLTPEDHAAALAFFEGRDEAHQLFHKVLSEVAKAGPFDLAATKSRVSLVARTRFAWCHEANEDGSIWLGFLLPRRVDSPRMRSGPVGQRWSHHVKLAGPQDLDAELVGWLHEAYRWDQAGVKDASAEKEPSAKRGARKGP
jgi:hypothetical protein